MSSLFEIRGIELKKFILQKKRLPKLWEVCFEDGEDERLWFNKISKIEEFKPLVLSVKEFLDMCNVRILTDKEKEEEFLNYISSRKQIPFYEEAYFSDNSEMSGWYNGYKQRNKTFETRVHDLLPEYRDLDLASIWTNIKIEFIHIIKQIKRIPDHGEFITQNGIDIRSIYDKLETFDPLFIEQLRHHLQIYKKDKFTDEDKISELLACVSKLGYIPYLQECRFSNGTDMYTWYEKYKNIYKDLDQKIAVALRKKINIYIIPNYREVGGRFYLICTNEGEQIDISDISSYEELLGKDSTVKKLGGLILKRNQEIGTISFPKK